MILIPIFDNEKIINWGDLIKSSFFVEKAGKNKWNYKQKCL